MARTPLALAVFNSAMTQREIAAALGISESHFSLVVNGKRNVDAATRDKIANLLGRSVHELWYGDIAA